jgi:ribosomal protein L23
MSLAGGMSLPLLTTGQVAVGQQPAAVATGVSKGRGPLKITDVKAILTAPAGIRLVVVKVNTMRMPGKARTVRTRKGMLSKEARPWKKAIVTLASGQSIPELQA